MKDQMKINDNITINHTSMEKLMPTLEDESIDIILTDPPYKYLKHKLETDWNEDFFFNEAKRLLTKDGFIVMFGRGTSFYRWNTILADLGFVFKEEIIWNKRYTNSPVMPIFRKHETVSISAKDKGIIRHTVIPYLEEKQYDLKSMVNDLKRIQAGVNNKVSFEKIMAFLETGERVYEKSPSGSGVTRHVNSSVNVDRSVVTINTMLNGNKPSSIFVVKRDHYNHIHPTQKPVRLLERLLELVVPDKPKNEITVLDPFGGSFSTMKAVHNMGLKGVSCEIDDDFFQAGMKRLKEYTAQMKLF